MNGCYVVKFQHPDTLRWDVYKRYFTRSGALMAVCMLQAQGLRALFRSDCKDAPLGVPAVTLSPGD